VKAQKNDDRDAEAIAEAATRPTMRFVELKNETQLDMQSLHRARDRLVGERTALINQMRAFRKRPPTAALRRCPYSHLHASRLKLNHHIQTATRKKGAEAALTEYLQGQ